MFQSPPTSFFYSTIYSVYIMVFHIYTGHNKHIYHICIYIYLSKWCSTYVYIYIYTYYIYIYTYHIYIYPNGHNLQLPFNKSREAFCSAPDPPSYRGPPTGNHVGMSGHTQKSAHSHGPWSKGVATRFVRFGEMRWNKMLDI